MLTKDEFEKALRTLYEVQQPEQHENEKTSFTHSVVAILLDYTDMTKELLEAAFQDSRERNLAVRSKIDDRIQ